MEASQATVRAETEGDPSAVRAPAAGRRPWLAPVVSAGAAVGATAWLASVDPNLPGRYPPCPFLLLTGLSCPGCGSLRTIHALTQGDLAAAAGCNVLTLFLLPVVVWLWWRWAGARVAGRPDVGPMARPIWGLLAVVVAFGVLRNLPVGAALAP